MEFLVILLVLLINHYWTNNRHVVSDSWFTVFQHWIIERLQKLPRNLRSYTLLLPILALAIPSVLLFLLLELVEGVGFGLITLLLHMALLLALFGRVHLANFTAHYLERWRQRDFESAFLMLQTETGQFALDSCDDRGALHQHFCRYLLTSSFERLFGHLFWYVLLGPVGVLLYHLLLLLRVDSERVLTVNDAAFVQRLVYLLEWVPARLLALTFSLAGDFVAAFGRLREMFFDLDRSAASVVFSCAMAAVGASPKTMLVREGQVDQARSSVLIEAAEEEDELAFNLQAECQIEGLVGLLARSQVIWVAILALLILYGVSI